MDEDGGSALTWAAYWENTRAVSVLLKYGASVNLKDNDNETALSYAASKEYVKVMELLLWRGADPYVVNSKGWNVLNWTASKGHVTVVKLLLDNGADPDIRDGMGRTALTCALDGNNFDAFKIIHKSICSAEEGAADNELEVGLVPFKPVGKINPTPLVRQRATGAAPAKRRRRSRLGETSASTVFQPSTQSGTTGLASAALYNPRLQPLLDELSSLIGLNSVKSDIMQTINFLRVQKLREDRGLSVPEHGFYWKSRNRKDHHCKTHC